MKKMSKKAKSWKGIYRTVNVKEIANKEIAKLIRNIVFTFHVNTLHVLEKGHIDYIEWDRYDDNHIDKAFDSDVDFEGGTYGCDCTYPEQYTYWYDSKELYINLDTIDWYAMNRYITRNMYQQEEFEEYVSEIGGPIAYNEYMNQIMKEVLESGI